MCTIASHPAPRALQVVLAAGAISLSMLTPTPLGATPADDRPASVPATADDPNSAPVTAGDPANAPAACSAVRVAVYPLDAGPVSAHVARVISNALLAEVRKLEQLDAIGMSEIQDMLSHEEAKQLLGCDDDSCLAEIGGALGVDELVTGSLGQIGGSSVLNVRRIDLQSARVRGAVDQRLAAAGGEEYLAAIGPAVEQLYPGCALKAGEQRGVPEETRQELSEPPIPSWLFWTAAGSSFGLGVLGGGAAATAAILVLNPLGSSVDLIGGSPEEERDADADSEPAAAPDATPWIIGTGVLLGTAGAVGVAALVMGFFTDWEE